ncbi:hypothetical protein FACS1894180_5960 [Bacteroidia bacterium]|nr:hypothetical protein FACS1894180_5960 [Bacteroidia bacterium]
MTAQVGINTETPSPNSALHIVAPNNDKGVILPQIPSDISLDEVVTSGSLPGGTSFDADGLVVYNQQTSCFNYYKQSVGTWYSLCGTPPPAIGTVNCSSGIEQIGVYMEDKVFNINNYLRVKITVVSPGTYSITAMPRTANGYYFSGSGVFPATGTYDIILSGAGTPTNPGTDEIDFVFNGTAQNCGYSLPIQEGTPDFCIISARQIPTTPWPVGQIFNASTAPSDLKYYAEVTVQVNKPGPYIITAIEQNGYDFTGTGQLYQASGYNPNGNFPQTVTVNIPVVAGKMANSNAQNTNTFQLTSVGANLCQTIYPLTITLAEIAFSVDCQGITLNNFGTLTQGTAIPDASTLTMQVTAASPGSTQITANFAGLSFSTGALGTPGEVTLTSGVQSVTLYPVTSGQKPNQAGTFPIQISSSKGGYASCATPKTVTVNAATAAFRNITISTFTNSSQYILNPYTGGADVPCDMVLSVQADVAGNYTLSTTVNGVTWSGTGNVPAGTSTITLTPVNPTANRPTSSGTKAVSLSYTQIVGGTSVPSVTNTQNVYFVQRKVNVLFVGGDAYSGFSASNNAGKMFRASNNFGPTGTMNVAGITPYNAGGSPSASALKTQINSNKIDIIVVGYNFITSNDQNIVLANFVNNKGGALIYSQENYASNAQALVQLISGVNLTFGNGGGGGTYINTMVTDASDPVINGPFGNLSGAYIGNDVANAMPVQSTTLGGTLKVLTRVLSTNNVWAFRDTARGFLYMSDSGWMAGHPSTYLTTTIYYPLQLNADNTPRTKAYDGGYQVSNSFLFGNALSWAIDWAAAHCNVNYMIP